MIIKKEKHQKEAGRTLVIAASMSAGLAIIKLIAFLYTGSLIVFASFFDSVTDTCTSLINNYIYRKALERADKEHPFGHGGFEVIGALIQGLLILFFSANIFMESFRKFFNNPNNFLDRKTLPIAVAALIFSALGGLGIQFFINHQIKKMKVRNERSLVILADKAHYAGDALANGASALGIVLIYFTGLEFLDPLLGCVAAFLLGRVSYPILKKAFKDIAHNEAPEELQQVIVNIVMSVDERIKGIHLLRSREFGPYLFVDFHMKVIELLSLKEAHKIGDKVEMEIKKIFPNADVIIHLDPENEPDQHYWSPSYTVPK